MLRPLLRARGAISFEEYMALALYHEEHGYYSDPARTRIGRCGDFATNSSVGPAFGRLLAHRLHRFWLAHGAPAPFQVVELGPEDGTLALDFLSAARLLDPAFHRALCYLACEPGARKRTALQTRLAASGEPRLHPIAAPGERPAGFGAVLANEVLDALPVRLVRRVHGAWNERLVTLGADQRLAFADHGRPDPALRARLDSLPPGLPDCYGTEVCLRYHDFFLDLAGSLERGLFLFIDYGWTRDDYYHPDRRTGTLRTYARHTPGDDPLDAPGCRDLTAHVEFTSALEAAGQAGFELLGFARQESYLTHLATPLLSALTDDPDSAAFLRQFRTLTHPALFGSAFQVLELTKGLRNESFPCPPPSGPSPF